MIKTVEQIKDKPINFIKEFINNCSIEEKIDTHYIIIEITSKQHITIKKSSGKIIDRVDMILNNIWGDLVTDWNFIRILNQDLFNQFIGYNISMFYFPNNKPILTEYKPIKYLIDRITFNDKNINPELFVNKIKLADKFNIKIKNKLNKNLNNISLNTITNVNKKEIDFTSLFDKIIDKDNNKIYALNKPEGFIFKWNKNLYQLLYNKRNKIIPEKTQYEYLLCDFINYCKTNNYEDKIQHSYVKTVCTLFNDYIINWEEQYHNIKNNIDINSIKSPSYNDNFDISYEYIPDIITINLCKKDELYKSIFKVLLANLKNNKDYKKCIFMNNSQVDKWNKIIKNIKIRTIVI
jgi:hypothetical protein